MTLLINGRTHKISCDPHLSLSEYLRDNVGLTGTKVSCGQGGCGSCVVMVTSQHPVSGKQVTKSINSCLCPVGSVVGCHITTVEGVGNQHTGHHPIQKSIAEHNGSQCGYCTPGMVMSTYSLLQKKPNPTATDIERCLDGNLCRCTGYRAIVGGMRKVLDNTNTLDIEDLHKFKCPAVHPPHKDLHNWMNPQCLQQVFTIFDEIPGKQVKLIFGNTASGYYKTREQWQADVITVNLTHVQELYKTKVDKTSLELGANLTIQEVIDELTEVGNSGKYPQFEYLKNTLVPMMYKLGNTAVRNAGSWAGNLMLRHTYTIFLSDLFTPLEALNAKINIANITGAKSYSPQEFLSVDMTSKVIVSLTLPALESGTEKFQAFKIMPRAASSLSIINAGFYIDIREANGAPSIINEARIVYGGLSTEFIHAKQTEEFMKGKEFSKELLKECLETLVRECDVSEEQYQCTAARNLLYLFLTNACDTKISSATFYKNTTKKISEITSTYDFEEKIKNFPSGKSMAKQDALLQCSGETQYVGDKPRLHNELQAYIVLASQAKANILNIDTTKTEKIEGVVRVITAKDICGENSFDTDIVDISPVPVLADKEVLYAGQPVALVVAENIHSARRGADALHVEYSDIGTPIMDITEAIEKAYVHKYDPDEYLYQRGDAKETLSGAYQVISGQVKLNTQYHFYMENQYCIVEPYDDMLDIWMTTQGPARVQTTVATVTGKHMSSINTHVLRLGGAFGGKCEYSQQIAGITAVAAQTLNRPVRLSLTTEQCMKLQGKRMPFVVKYQVGLSSSGKIECLLLDYYQDCGCKCVFLSSLILKQSLMHCETVYHIPHMLLRGHTMKTDKAYTVAMRAPVTLPGNFIMEVIMEKVSYHLKVDPVQYKQQHLIKAGDPFLRSGGSFNTDTISKLMNDLQANSQIEKWKQEVATFNKENLLKKRGLAVIPTRSTISYFNKMLTYGAYVTIHTHDGTVSITHAGVEMGQGINIKAIQTAATILNVSPDFIRVHRTMTITSSNSHHSAGSVTSEGVCRSVMECCKELNRRLDPYRTSNKNLPWIDLVQEANTAGTDLAVSNKYMQSDTYYSTYGVCALEAEVDLLTGEHHVNRLDAIFDVGESMNPLIDIGQIEGALCMSLGYFSMEYETYDKKTGQLLTNGTWDYKPPTVLDIPRKMDVKLMKNSIHKDGAMGFKAIGEPPINCGPAVLSAVQQAIQSYQIAKDKLDYVQLQQPLTPQEILMKAEVSLEDLLNCV